MGIEKYKRHRRSSKAAWRKLELCKAFVLESGGRLYFVNRGGNATEIYEDGRRVGNNPSVRASTLLDPANRPLPGR